MSYHLCRTHERDHIVEQMRLPDHHSRQTFMVHVCNVDVKVVSRQLQTYRHSQ